MRTEARRAFPALAALLLVVAAPGGAQTVDVEVDPIAYALDGYSVAVGASTEDLRYEAEVFGLRVPEEVHGNPGFTQRVRGVSLKASYYPTGTDGGVFVGADVDLASTRLTHDGTDASTVETRLGAGVTAGVRIHLTPDLYVKPWGGVSHTFAATDVAVSGRTFRRDPWSLFPALSVGWRF